LGTGPYVYTYNGALTAVTSNPRIQTLYFGDSTDGVYKLTGATATKLHYSIKNADRLMFDVDGIGKQIASGASFAPLSDRTVTPIMAGDMTVYIDAWGGTIGTTAVPATVYSLDLTITAKRDLRYYLGAYTPGRVREFDVFDFDLKLTLEFLSGVTDAYLNSILALSSGSVFQKQVRLKATSGTNIFQIDLAGTNEKAPDMWTYDNNVQTVELTLKGTYNATLANWLKASVTNSISTLA
jgi:hypothetical protein